MNSDFRKADVRDKAVIEELFIEMLQSICGTETVDGYEPEYLNKYFSGGEDCIFVAELNGKVIGYISVEIKREDRHFAYIDDFCVKKDYRSKGLGTMLLQISEDYAENCKMQAILLHVVKVNTAAQRLYARSGYKLYRTEENRFLLVKELGESNG